MRTRICLLLAVAFWMVSPPSGAQTYNLFDYWLSPPGVCTSSNPLDPGTYSYQYSAGRNCTVAGRGSKPLYMVAKGTWADESLVVDNGWLYILTERHPSVCNGSYNYRLWDANGVYGVPWAKTSFGTSTVTWSDPLYTMKCGATCGSTSFNISAGGEYNEQGILGMIWDKLYDCRSGTCTGPIPMETMVVRGHWGQHSGISCGTHFDHAEEYWYGRGDITPNDNIANPRSLGLVRFVSSLYNHSTCSYVEDSSSWVSYLKNCTLAASCPFC